VAQAPRQFEELCESLHLIHRRPASGIAFFIDRWNQFALGGVTDSIVVADPIIDADGICKIRFARVPNDINPDAIAYRVGDWSLNPIVENGLFKWEVPELQNQAFANDELANQIAVRMTEIIKSELDDHSTVNWCS